MTLAFRRRIHAWVACCLSLAPAATGQFDAGNVVVVDSTKAKLVEFNAHGAFKRVLVDAGSGLRKPWGIAYGPGDSLFVSDAALDKIFKVDAGGGCEVFAQLGKGDGPRALTLGPHGELFVACREGRKIVVIGQNGLVVRDIALDSDNGEPTSVAFDLDGHILIPTTKGDLLVIDQSSGTIISKLHIDGVPSDIAVTRNGIALIALPGAKKVLMVQPRTAAMSYENTPSAAEGLCIPSDGVGWLAALPGDHCVYRTQFGWLGSFVFRMKDVDTPSDLLVIPYSASVKLELRKHSEVDGIDAPAGADGNTVARGRLSFYPGTAQVLLELTDANVKAFDAIFPLVFVGVQSTQWVPDTERTECWAYLIERSRCDRFSAAGLAMRWTIGDGSEGAGINVELKDGIITYAQSGAETIVLTGKIELDDG